MNTWNLLLAMCLVTAACKAEGSGPRVRVSTVGLEKPAPGFEPSVAKEASASGMRGETVAAVFRLDAVSCQSLTLDEGPFSVRLFEMRPVTLDKPSFEGARLGKHYDPLVPLDLSRICPERGENHAWIWADIRIPESAPAGKHSIKLAPGQAPGASLEIVVWKGVFPKRPSLPIYVNVIPWFIVNGHHGGWHADEAELGARYVRAAMEHGLYPMNQHLAPLKLEGGRISLGTGPGSFRAMTLDLVPPDAKVFIPIEPRNPQHLTPEYLGAIEKMIKAEGLKGRAVSYLWDEPDGEDLDRTEAAARLLKKHAPSLEILVTTAYAPRFQELIDLFVPVAELFKPADYAGRSFWLYVSCMSHGCGEPPFIGKTSGAPDLVTDRPAIFARAFPWVLERIGARAGLYFNTVESYMRGAKDPWKSNYLFTGNGDGTLFYPDKAGHQPIASIRLKLLRQGINDVEYLRLAAKAGLTEPLREFRSIVKDAKDFDKDHSRYEKIRRRIGEALNGE